MGEVLIELDATSADAEIRGTQGDLLAARIDRARSAAMLQAIDAQQVPVLARDSLQVASAEQTLGAERWLQGQYQEYRSQLALADAEILQRTADIQAAQVQVASLRQTLPIATQLSEHQGPACGAVAGHVGDGGGQDRFAAGVGLLLEPVAAACSREFAGALGRWGSVLRGSNRYRDKGLVSRGRFQSP